MLKEGICLKGCIIGSFRKYYDDILHIIDLFEKSGHIVLSPKSSQIVKDENGFVILKSDNPDFSHIDIQTIVFHRAFRSDFVYVWNPSGYIGKTTCYEIGRLIERGIPIFYKEMPTDVPIYIPQGSIIPVDVFIEYISTQNELPRYKQESNPLTAQLIRNLQDGIFYE